MAPSILQSISITYYNVVMCIFFVKIFLSWSNIYQVVSDPQNPQCLTDALFRHQTREKLPNGNPKIDETDIHMMIQESIGAGGLTFTPFNPNTFAIVLVCCLLFHKHPIAKTLAQVFQIFGRTGQG